MASGRFEPKPKGGEIWLKVLSNRGRRVLYDFGSQPRPKVFPFWPRPNMLRSGNQCRILKQTLPKPLPALVSLSNDGQKFKKQR